ncbi:Hypothetical predicted protein [Octopus vulgaris]|uniref:Uncharacterized protein n=1 Tax=Octopus vulgaris TaxID=6645 RepID=A0AA36BPY8_OCTVU|nr:Hypothetical predicted protein [Octopus vulgaris]
MKLRCYLNYEICSLTKAAILKIGSIFSICIYKVCDIALSNGQAAVQGEEDEEEIMELDKRIRMKATVNRFVCAEHRTC